MLKLNASVESTVQKIRWTNTANSAKRDPSSRIKEFIYEKTSENMGDLAKSKRIRGGHRGYLKKILGQASGMLENFSEEVRHEAFQIKEGILDSIRILQKLDEEIVELIGSDKASNEEDITKE